MRFYSFKERIKEIKMFLERQQTVDPREIAPQVGRDLFGSSFTLFYFNGLHFET